MEKLEKKMKGQKQKNVSFTKNKRIRKEKNFIQMVYLQNLNKRLKEVQSSEQKQNIIDKSAQILNMKNRQLYKWLWDEKIRENQRTVQQQTNLEGENDTLYNATMTNVMKLIKDPQSYIIDTIYIGKNKSLSSEASLKLWEFKLFEMQRNQILLFQSNKPVGE